jgi:Ca-activated chloride channel family protein
MRLLHPEFLWLLALLPLLALMRGRRGPAPALLFSSTAVASAIGSGRRSIFGALLGSFNLLAIAFLILALARPQLGRTTTEIEASGIDIFLAVDVSSSMEAMDFQLDKKSVNRLEVVKSVVSQFIRERPNDRIGLIAFSAKPYLISPLTLDHDWLLQRLQALSIGMIEDGTAIGSAIGTGSSRLNSQQAKSRLLILLTDGMNTAGRIPPLVAAEAAQALGVKVYTIGAGTRGVAPTPYTDPFGRKSIRRVNVNIDEATLKAIAEKTGGRYFRATDTSSLARIYKEIDKMETTTRTIKQFENYRELFSACIGLALLFITIGLFMRRTMLP